MLHDQRQIRSKQEKTKEKRKVQDEGARPCKVEESRRRNRRFYYLSRREENKRERKGKEEKE
jgi:hypothetical protein